MDDSIDNLSSIVRFTGINVPARALFVGETLVASTLSGLTVGLVCGQIGVMATPIGPLLPFLCGFQCGSILGLVGHWKACRNDCLHYAAHYPNILSHALWVTRKVRVPQEILESHRLQEWVLHDWGRLSFAILAAQTCRMDVEEIERNRRQKLVEESSEEVDESNYEK